MRRLNVLLAGLLPLLLAGCVIGTVREKRDTACGHLVTLDSTIAAVRRVVDTSTTTVSALKQAQERVIVAFNNVKAAIKDVPEANLEELEDAYGDLDEAIQDIPDQSTIIQKKEALRGYVAKVEAASTKMQSGLRCRP